MEFKATATCNVCLSRLALYASFLQQLRASTSCSSQDNIMSENSDLAHQFTCWCASDYVSFYFP